MGHSRVELHGIFEKGKFTPDLPQAAVWAALGARFQGRCLVTIEPESKLRTLRQNSRYWSLLEPVAQEVLSQGREIPLSKQQTHGILAGAFVGHEETDLKCKCHGVGLIYRSTKHLSTVDFSKFSDEVDRWLIQKGCNLTGLDTWTEGP